MAQFKMQESVQDLINKLEKIKAYEFAKDYVIKNEDFVLQLNKDQLQRGERNDNTEITPYYRNFAYKNRFSPVDLRLTGAFYKSFKIKYTDKGFYIFATDVKTGKLLAKYGEDVLGLTEHSITEVRKELYIFISNYLKKELL